MKNKRITINGFGRIGRAVFKNLLTLKTVEVVAINDLASAEMLAHLLQYDTVYGKYEKKVQAVKGGLKVDGKFYPVLAEKEPAKLPWDNLRVDVVLECTGIFTKKELAVNHIKAGAKRVIISAPAKDEETQTLVSGTESTAKCVKKGKCDEIFSMASCTTGCISPVMQVLASAFGVDKSIMTTIHSYTATQNLVDGPHKDMRRARAAAQNMVLTTTGAAKATAKAIPSLEGSFDGVAVRVPTICGSLSDITAVLKKKATAEQINKAFIKATRNPLFKGVLAVNREPLVSSDYIKNPHSAIVDLDFTKVVGGNLVKIFAWYDNEWAYSRRLAEMASVV